MEGPKKGSPRVAAWIHAVLNPWVDAVENELAILGRGGTTWRYLPRRLEFILPMKDYVAVAHHTLDDYLRARPESKPKVEEHDRHRDDLERAACGAHDELVKRPEFRSLVADRLRKFTTTAPVRGNPRARVKVAPEQQRPNPASGVREFPSLVAERIINQVQELPEYYTDHAFWNLYRGDFLAMRHGRAFETLDASHAGLEGFNRIFRDTLKDWRFALLEEYDVPPAPLEP